MPSAYVVSRWPCKVLHFLYSLPTYRGFRLLEVEEEEEEEEEDIICMPFSTTSSTSLGMSISIIFDHSLSPFFLFLSPCRKFYRILIGFSNRILLINKIFTDS